MGARRFSIFSKGRTPEEAFQNAVAFAKEQFGHRGHTGTIADKKEFVMIERTSKGDPLFQADKMMDNFDKRIKNALGPAGCMQYETIPETLNEIHIIPSEKVSASKGEIEDLKEIKWKTYYTLWVHGKRFDKFNKKTDAVKAARASALSLQEEIIVKIEQLPVTGDGILSVMKPMTKRVKVTHDVPVSTYLFFGFSNCDGLNLPNVPEGYLKYLQDSEELA